MRRAARMSAIAIAVAAQVGVAPVRAGEPEREVPFSAVGELGADGIVELRAAVGPIVLQEVLVQNAPTEQEAARATGEQRARPRPVLVVTNPGPGAVRLTFDLTFEDGEGHALLTCAVQKKQEPGWNELIERICHEEMRLLDWPRVKVVRVVGTARVRP